MDRELSVDGKNSAPVGITRPDGVKVTAPPDLFLFDPANQAFLEGSTIQPNLKAGRGRTNSRSNYLIWIVAIGLFVYATFDSARFLLLNFAGETTQGIVTDSRSKVTKDTTREGHTTTSTSYYVTYSFSVGEDPGHVYSKEISVDYAAYYRLKPGAPVEIVYWTGGPFISNIADYDVFPMISVVIAAAGGILAIFQIADFVRARRRSKIARCGQVRFGVLTSWDVDKMNPDQGMAYWDVVAEYCFEGPGGRTIHGSEHFRTTDHGVAANHQGKHVAVLYLNEKSYAVL